MTKRNWYVRASQSLEYQYKGRYSAMMRRCYNEKHPSYHRYGGRGIDVCELWRNNRQAYIDWCLLNHETNKQIDRIDNDKGYSPYNCRFVTPKMNVANAHSMPLGATGERYIYWDTFTNKYKVESKERKIKTKRFTFLQEAIEYRDIQLKEHI